MEINKIKDQINKNKKAKIGVFSCLGCFGLLLLCTLTLYIIGLNSPSPSNSQPQEQISQTVTPEASKKAEVTITSTQTPTNTPTVIPTPEFKLNAIDFNNAKVEDLLKKYPGSYVKEEVAPMASNFYLKNEHVNLSASYKADSKVVTKFTTQLLKFECKEQQKYSALEVNKYLNYLGMNNVNDSDIKYSSVSGVTSIVGKNGWSTISFNCFEDKKVDITFVNK